MVPWYWAVAAFIIGMFAGAIMLMAALDKEGKK